MRPCKGCAPLALIRSAIALSHDGIIHRPQWPDSVGDIIKNHLDTPSDDDQDMNVMRVATMKPSKVS